MRKTFVESRDFSAQRERFMDDEAFRALQNDLMVFPDRGDVMSGCGGLRKLRVADPSRGKGKRGGARIVYLHIPEAHRIDFLMIYGKDEQDDLSADEKKTLRAIAERMRKEALAHLRRRDKK